MPEHQADPAESAEAKEPPESPESERQTEPQVEDPLWERLEVAWPLAILAGFAGTWIGLLWGLPGAALLLSFAGFAPLYRLQLRAGRRGAAAVLSILWILGIVGATVGTALEGALAPVVQALPFAEALVESELGSARPAHGWATLPRNALVACAVLALARPLFGWAALALAGLGAGAVAGVSASAAAGAVDSGLAPSLAALAGLPPHLFLGLVALQLGIAALAQPGSASEEPFTDLRRALLWSALGLLGVALGLQSFWIEAWQGWLGG